MTLKGCHKISIFLIFGKLKTADFFSKVSYWQADTFEAYKYNSPVFAHPTFSYEETGQLCCFMWKKGGIKKSNVILMDIQTSITGFMLGYVQTKVRYTGRQNYWHLVLLWEGEGLSARTVQAFFTEKTEGTPKHKTFLWEAQIRMKIQFLKRRVLSEITDNWKSIKVR